MLNVATQLKVCEEGFFLPSSTYMTPKPLWWHKQTFATITKCVQWLNWTCFLALYVHMVLTVIADLPVFIRNSSIVLAHLCNLLLSAKTFDLCRLWFLVSVLFFFCVSLAHFSPWLSFDVVPTSFACLNFSACSYPSTQSVSNFPWLITESKSFLIACNSMLTAVKIFVHVILILIAAAAAAWSGNATSVFHCLHILSFCWLFPSPSRNFLFVFANSSFCYTDTVAAGDYMLWESYIRIQFVRA